jgi:hypothetical protein
MFANAVLTGSGKRETGCSFSTGQFGNHGGEDREQFFGFAQKSLDGLAGNAAVVAKQFKPKLRFIQR